MSLKLALFCQLIFPIQTKKNGIEESNAEFKIKCNKIIKVGLYCEGEI